MSDKIASLVAEIGACALTSLLLSLAFDLPFWRTFAGVTGCLALLSLTVDLLRKLVTP